jgi:hypothetical protein
MQTCRWLSSPITLIELLVITTTNLVGPAHDIDIRHLLWTSNFELVEGAKGVDAELVRTAEQYIQGLMIFGGSSLRAELRTHMSCVVRMICGPTGYTSPRPAEHGRDSDRMQGR